MKNAPLRIVSATVLLFASFGWAQSKVRTALIPADGVSNVPETLTINELEHTLVADGQIELIDRRLINQTMAEQNFQSLSGRVDAASAAKFGALLGVPALVFIRCDGYNATTKTTPKFGGEKLSGTIYFQMTALLIDVQTGAILAAPTSKIDQKDQFLKDSKMGRPVSAQETKDAFTEMNKQAFQSVVSELSPQLIAALKKVAPAASVKHLQVAGVRNNKTYLNGGADDGVKEGDRYQIVRMADNGLKNPATNKPILERTNICVLTITTVQPTQLSSGDCAGGVAQLGDDASPVAKP
jgi:hypothetical protein